MKESLGSPRAPRRRVRAGEHRACGRAPPPRLSGPRSSPARATGGPASPSRGAAARLELRRDSGSPAGLLRAGLQRRPPDLRRACVGGGGRARREGPPTPASGARTGGLELCDRVHGTRRPRASRPGARPHPSMVDLKLGGGPASNSRPARVVSAAASESTQPLVICFLFFLTFLK